MKNNQPLRKRHYVHHRLKKALLLACKIGLGSAFAIYLTSALGLENAMGAGTITLLTLVNSKWGTLQLITKRYVTFFIATTLCLVLFQVSTNHYLTFGIFLLLIVFITEMLGWGSTLSVNALIGMHFMVQETLDFQFVLNEFWLLSIGVFLAFLLNLFNNAESTKHHLYRCIHYSDLKMQSLLQDVARYIRAEEHIHPWRKMNQLLNELQAFRNEAQQYQDDTFTSAPQCFIDYFDMRLRQYHIVENLHSEIRKIRSMPSQAVIVAEYVEYLIPYVTDHNVPNDQIYQLHCLIESLKDEYQFNSRVEFEDQAILFHILMDLDDFLNQKKKFLDEMNEDEAALFFVTSAHHIFESKSLK